MNLVFEIFIIFCAFAGLLISLYIFHTKRKEEHLVCPMHGSCETVMQSRFAHIFGIPVDFLGICYYSVVAFGYGAILAVPQWATPLSSFGLLALSAAAFLFSIYLTFVQGVSIKHWCTWCLTSAALCAAIFFLSLAGLYGSIQALMLAHQEWLMLLHTFALSVGVGSVIVGGRLLQEFVADFRISSREAGILHATGQGMWIGIITMAVTGFALYLPDAVQYNEMPVFWATLLVYLAIVANSAMLDLVAIPKLLHISTTHLRASHLRLLHDARASVLMHQGVSIVSWFYLFVLVLFQPVNTVELVPLLLFPIFLFVVLWLIVLILEPRMPTAKG